MKKFSSLLNIRQEFQLSTSNFHSYAGRRHSNNTKLKSNRDHIGGASISQKSKPLHLMALVVFLFLFLSEERIWSKLKLLRCKGIWKPATPAQGQHLQGLGEDLGCLSLDIMGSSWKLSHEVVTSVGCWARFSCFLFFFPSG